MKSLLFVIFAISCGMFWVAPHALVPDPQWRENPSVISFGGITHEGSKYRLTGRWEIDCTGDTPVQVAPGVRFCGNTAALEIDPGIDIELNGLTIICTQCFRNASQTEKEK